MSADKLTPQSEDFSEWYNQIVMKADMADYGPVRGTMIVKPYGWKLWETIQAELNTRFAEYGVENAAFPIFIPMNFLTKEADHVEGFAPELAVVTQGGGKELAEPIVVRPTSETVIGDAYSRWIQSFRDLPVLMNCWNNVVRWEMRTRIFLRTMEFYWQEGHSAHATAEEADKHARDMLIDAYTDFAVNVAAVPVVPGEKSDVERFPGADRTYTIEAMMGDGKALQSGTSHNLGQNFAKAFDIKYLSAENERKFCWTTSWGLSTRFIGAIIMTHGDDSGLIMPPRIAPIQVVIVPIGKKEKDKAAVKPVAERIFGELKAAGIRVKMDDRDNMSPGAKYHDWEMRGVPVRMEIGPRDVEKNSVALARRDVPGRDGKSFVPQENIVANVQELLDMVQDALLDRATQFREANTHDVSSYDGFKTAVSTGWARVWWAGSDEDEQMVKEETKATLRCYPLDQPEGEGVCFYTGKPATRVALFGRAY